MLSWLSRFFLALALFAGPLQAESMRKALVVGNGNYGAVQTLENPVSDAMLMANRLGDLGFEVSMIIDGTQIEMRRAIAQFGRDLRASGPETVGLFYYAGHGVQSFGANYLLPVDASLTDAADLDLVALEAQTILRQMASARNRTNIVILDACRDNPFETIADLDDNGLAEMKAPAGTFLAYATAPGAVALDGLGENSPFTTALAEEILIEDIPIEQMFKKVRVRVRDATSGLQTPWDTSSLTVDFKFKPGKTLSAEDLAAKQFWESVKDTSDPVQIMLFLRAYPDSAFSQEARGLLKSAMQSELESAETSAPQTKAPVTPSDQEADLLETARASGDLGDYQAYLDAFPDGVFAELAKLEMAALSQAAAPPEAEADEPTQTVSVTGRTAPTEQEISVFFDQPLINGAPEIVGKTIMEVTTLSPIFPPIEGLPEEMWKDQSCANCHQWDRTALCDQAKTYLKASAERSLAKQHPLGGSFKNNLRVWAEGGCQ